MIRDSNFIYLDTPGGTLQLGWVDNAPNFSHLTEPTYSVALKTWNDFVDSNQELEIIPDPELFVEPSIPGWILFNEAISFDSNMIDYEFAANQIHPSIVGKKDLAYTIIDDKGIDNFAMAFPLFCVIAGVTQEHRNGWADLATSFNLPQDFIDVVRGI